jgi:hypothetical protein
MSTSEHPANLALIDTNVLVYAADTTAVFHDQVKNSGIAVYVVSCRWQAVPRGAVACSFTPALSLTGTGEARTALLNPLLCDIGTRR